MRIENMTADHVAQVAALEAVCFADPWSERSVASELNDPLSLWLVAMEGERLAGYIGSQTVMGETDMMNIAVDPEFRRRGIAEELIGALVAELKAMESHCLTLEVRPSNEPAKALYEKLGFRQVGLRKNYYRNPREDALILRREWQI